MFDLLLAAQAASPTQSISLLQLVIAFAAVVVSLAGLLFMADKRGMERSKQIRDVVKESEERLRSENEKAHAGISENVKENRRQIETIATAMHSIDRSVTFLSGRQHERDQRGGD